MHAKLRMPMPLKSVAGSLPWKPISVHCLLTRDSRGDPGIIKSHSYACHHGNNTAVNVVMRHRLQHCRPTLVS